MIDERPSWLETCDPHGPLPSLSVVIPAYNEAHRIRQPLHSLTAYLRARRFRYEIVVVDDGSEDATVEVLQGVQREDARVRIIHLPRNRGKGHAVRLGMREAIGELRLLADADGAAPIEELPRLERAIAAGADVAIGSRALAWPQPGYCVRARWHRTVLGTLFNRLVQHAGLSGIHDTQCGFKLFRATAADTLFAACQIDGYGFDLEVLSLARLWHYRIAEVPINWADQPGSKVRLLRDGCRLLSDLLAIRHYARRGAYGLGRKPSPVPVSLRRAR